MTRKPKLFCLLLTFVVLFSNLFSPNTVFASDVTADDVAWTWWTYPLITYSPKAGKYYFGFTTSHGKQGAGIFNPTTGRVNRRVYKSKATADDHNAAAIDVLPDGRIISAFSTGHNQDSKIHIRISKARSSIKSWKKEVVLSSKGRTSYANLFHFNGKTWLFYRRHTADSWAWIARTTTDLKHWSGEKVIVYAEPQYYCLFKKTKKANILRLVFTTNPAETDPDIRMGFLDLKKETIFNADANTSFGQLNETGTYYRDFTILIPNPGSKKTQRLFDVAVTNPGTTVLAYCRMKRANVAGGAAYYIYKNGTSHVLTKSEKSFRDSYYGGVSFINSKKVIVSENHHNRDQINLYSLQGTKKKRKKNLATSPSASIRLIRPVVYKKCAMWQKGKYSSSYKSFKLQAVFHML